MVTQAQVAWTIREHANWWTYNSVTLTAKCKGCGAEVSYCPEDIGTDDVHDEGAIDYAMQGHAAAKVMVLL